MSLSTLPRLEDPILSQWNSVIITPFPGESAERVEALVTHPLEEALIEIKGIESLGSTSRPGSSTIVIELNGYVTDVHGIWSRVRDRLKDIAVDLPPGALPPQFEEVDLRAYTLVVGLTWEQETNPNFVILNRKIKELESWLRNIPGTEDVDFFAEPQEEITVTADETSLSALGLTPRDLSEALLVSNSQTNSGQINSNRNSLRLDLNSGLDSLERIQKTPLKSGNNNQQIIIGDVASVTKGIEDPPRQRAYLNGEPGIVIAARIAPDVRIDQWIDRANQKLEDFREQLPAEIGLNRISDQSQYVNPRINALFQNLIVGALFVYMTTLLMMGWRAALAISLIMPLTAFMVFGGMRIFNVSFDQISITGLVMALGMLIDSAIVMGDELLRLFKAGLTQLQAITTATKNLFVPFLASTLTTVISFVPIVILPGSVGEFVRSIGINIILALLISLFLSLTVIPSLMAYLHPIVSQPGEPYPYRAAGLNSPKLTRLYAHILDTSLSKPVISIAMCLIVPISGFFLVGTLDEQFFPPSQRNQFHIELELPGAASFQRTESLTLEVQETLMQHPEIEQVNWFIGQYAPAFYYNLPRGGKNIPNFAHGIVQTQRSEGNYQLINELQRELDQAYPEAQILVRALEQGPYIPAPIEIHIAGPDLDQLRTIGDRIRVALVELNGITHTRASLTDTVPRVAINLDEEQTRLAGLDRSIISQQLSANFDGVTDSSLLDSIEEIPIRVQLGRDEDRDLNALENLEILGSLDSSNGTRIKVPLSTLSTLTLEPQESTVTRRNGVAVNTIQGFLSTEILPSQAQKQFKYWLDRNLELPPGYEIKFGGETEKRDSSIAGLLATIVPLMVLMLVTLVLSFRSFRGAGIIIIVSILSIGLGFFSLAIFNYPLGFMAILGMVSMVGMAINDSIVTLSALKEFPEHQRGDRLIIRNVILRNTRHILTTTLTTVAGFIPLFLDGGLFWPPLVACIAGGVTGATALSIFFVPNLYLLMFRPRSIKRSLLPNSKT